eukprot:UN22761
MYLNYIFKKTLKLLPLLFCERLKRKDWASIWLVVFTAFALALIGRVALVDIYAVQSLKMGVVFIGLALLR